LWAVFAIPQRLYFVAKAYKEFYEGPHGPGLELDLKKAATEKGMLAVFAELKKAARIKYPTAGEEQLPAMALGHLKFMAANWGSLNHYLKGQISPAKLASKDNLSQVIMALKPGTNNGQKQNQPIQLEKPDVAKTAARFNQITI